MRVIGEILAFVPQSRGTDLKAALDLLGRTVHRRSVVFLVSDFMTKVESWERPMQICRQRHELVPVVVEDPLERELPPVGLVVLEDLETGQLVEVDTSGYAAKRFAARARAAAAARDSALRRLECEIVSLRTDEPYVDALIAFFKARAKRMAHG
jgi:uncharacterized protein (DUF58 family)